MNLAIIPARGGSKRIPRKNIKHFNRKPIIAYAIEVARSSTLFDHVVVSTDDDEISAIANEYGAETPFVRPDKLADDHSTTAQVIGHGIQTCRTLGWEFERVCCIYPSTPLTEVDDLNGALELLIKTGADYCFPIAEYPSPVQRALKKSNDGRLKPFYPQNETTRTQDLEASFYDAGQFYWGGVEAWLSGTNIHSSGVGYLIPRWRAIDIDTQEDWNNAEKIYSCLSLL